MKTFGPVEENARKQLERCQAAEEGSEAVLCADHHLGYSMPIGGVIGYEDLISPSAVGYDIGCGNMAVETEVLAKDIDTKKVMDEIWDSISFGVGLKNKTKNDHPVLDKIGDSPIGYQRSLKDLAASQLGTVGSGNHYVDLFEDITSGRLWVGVHFGSRGFGHKTATWVLQQTETKNTSMDAPPVVIPFHSELGQGYFEGMKIAGEYASAGRWWVVNRVLQILGTPEIQTIHNHHNFAWLEQHGERTMLVHRKGATPAFPGQKGFVGGTMGSNAVILEGCESTDSVEALYSTVHGAGRVISRSKASGKFKKGKLVTSGIVDWNLARAEVHARGVELRGAGADEAPECYKQLEDVLRYHGNTIKILHTLRPIGVAMASVDTYDPFKD